MTQISIYGADDELLIGSDPERKGPIHVAIVIHVIPVKGPGMLVRITVLFPIGRFVWSQPPPPEVAGRFGGVGTEADDGRRRHHTREGLVILCASLPTVRKFL